MEALKCRRRFVINVDGWLNAQSSSSAVSGSSSIVGSASSDTISFSLACGISCGSSPITKLRLTLSPDTPSAAYSWKCLDSWSVNRAAALKSVSFTDCDVNVLVSLSYPDLIIGAYARRHIK